MATTQRDKLSVQEGFVDTDVFFGTEICLNLKKKRNLIDSVCLTQGLFQTFLEK